MSRLGRKDRAAAVKGPGAQVLGELEPAGGLVPEGDAPLEEGVAPQLEGEGPAGLGAAGEQVQVEAVVGYPVHGERDEVDGPQKQAGSCKDQQEDRPGKGEEKGGQGRRQGGKQIGQAAPKIIKPEGDLVPVWGSSRHWPPVPGR